MAARYEGATSVDLIDFQNKLLGKIKDRDASSEKIAEQWLGFVINKNKYVVNLLRVQEVITAPNAYLGLGDWVSKNVKGGLQHRDDVWAVYEGVACDTERSHETGFPWEYRIILLRPGEVDGNLAVGVDKVVGLMPNLSKQTSVKGGAWGVDFEVVVGEEKWKVWDPLVWKSEEAIRKLTA